MTFISDAWQWLAGAPQQRQGVRILQFMLGIMLVSRLATELPFAAHLWGPHGLGYGTTVPLVGKTIGHALDHMFDSMWGTYAVLAGLGAGAFALVVGRTTRVATGLTLFCYLLLEYRLPELGDGGDNVTRLVLGYMLFLLPAGADAARGSMRAWFHNLAVAAIGMQLMTVYVTSGLMKAAGESWQNGTALYLVSQVEWFSHPSLRAGFTNPLIVMVATYTAMLFQLWFPVAVFSRFRLAFLAIGISMHLGIAIMMGLVHFSSVMIALELFLITEREWAELAAFAKRTRARISTRVFGGASPEPTHVLYIDGRCPTCVGVGERLARMDHRARLRICSFRDDDSHKNYGISREDLERRMYVLDIRSIRAHAGFDAVRELARQVPCLAPLRPLLAMAGALGIGHRAYDAFAARRWIVPDPTACGDQCPIARGQS